MNIDEQKAERLHRIEDVLVEHDYAALICSLNLNVLMVSGYWPVTGPAVAIATAEPCVYLLVPDDEKELASLGWADKVYSYSPASLTTLKSAPEALMQALCTVLSALHLQEAKLCCESGAGQAMSSYVAQSVLGSMLGELVLHAVPDARLHPADELLKRLRMRPTQWECDRIRAACRIAGQAFEGGARGLKPGMTETEATKPFRDALIEAGRAGNDSTRADGFFYCMAGVHAVTASAAFQQSGDASLRNGEPILVHCNSYLDGYWTDLTRTYVLGAPDERLQQLFEALVSAREAAFANIRPGVCASVVDRAARTALTDKGYGAAFCHGAGHGVGFSAIDHEEWPEIHPCSTRILEEGMVFNIEPGIYLPGYGGLRDCNMVAVTANGYELLSPFQRGPEDWCLVT